MEVLKSEQQKEIINELIKELTNEHMDLYYTDSSTIAHMVEQKIKSKSLGQNKFDLVKDLSQDDILILMSYKSNCC